MPSKTMDPHGHIPVLPEEVMTLLSPQPGETVVDCTSGRGGHSVMLAQAVGRAGTVIGFDLDEENLKLTRVRVEELGCRFIPIHDTFSNLKHHLDSLTQGPTPPGKVDLLLADLGFASSQMDDPSRGFSFSADGPLDMRYDRRGNRTTAAHLLATLTERELADLIYQYGEDPFARKIARKLAHEREIQPIETTARLARLVQEAYGPKARFSRMHPATRTFMALRIAVNDELGSLESLLSQITAATERIHEGHSWLNPGARIAIVAFHSLEDRIVKHAFADLAKRSLATRLTKKPLTCSDTEARANPRARSAKLRAIRIGSPDG